MANPGTTTAIGSLTLRDGAGTQTGTYSFSLPASQHTAVFLFQIIQGAKSGRAEINVSQGVVSVTALRFHTTSVFTTVSVGATAAVSALFSPNGGVRAKIISDIDKAASTIDIAIYSFTSDDIRDALVRAKNRGVVIRIIADTSQASGQGSEIALLESMGFNLKRMSGGSGGIMHNKYMIIDGNTLLTGSYNWSANAEDNNLENAIFLQGAAVIQRYVEDFSKLWVR